MQCKARVRTIERLKLTDEGNISKYLGVDVKSHDDGTIELRQPYLIDRVIKDLNLDQSNTHDVPAVPPLLHKDLEGSEKSAGWNFRSVVGMLNYIANCTRPDISFATHQCARFSNNPKRSHETAIKRIGRYLKLTRDKGIILKVNRNLGLECYVDADFAGGWNRNDADDASTVLSRTGYVIRYMGCPLLWVSKLQTEISLSTTEAEYIALSQSLRDVLPLIELIKEVNDVLKIEGQPPKVYCKVFEDNNGALELAKAPKMRPRTKHIALKYHHFRAAARDGRVAIFPIDTKQKIADIFTKPLYKVTFEHLRELLLNW